MACPYFLPDQIMQLHSLTPVTLSSLTRSQVQAGLGLALAAVFVALNAATGNWRAAALATFCVVGTFASAAGLGSAMLYWRLGVPVAVPLMLMLACAPPGPTVRGRICRASSRRRPPGACTSWLALGLKITF